MARLMSVAFTEDAVRERLTAEIVRGLLDYDAEVGEFRWRRTGAVAGWTEPTGYVRVCINRKKYLAHRLAWLYVHGDWPGGELDHINGVRDDYRIVNIREVDRAANTQNLRGAHADSASGLAGAWSSAGRWQSGVMVNGVMHWLGRFDSAHEAHAAYVAAKRVLHPDWMGCECLG